MRTRRFRIYYIRKDRLLNEEFDVERGVSLASVEEEARQICREENAQPVVLVQLAARTGHETVVEAWI